VALVWIYTEQQPSEHLETIGSIDAQHIELIVVAAPKSRGPPNCVPFPSPTSPFKL